MGIAAGQSVLRARSNRTVHQCPRYGTFGWLETLMRPEPETEEFAIAISDWEPRTFMPARSILGRAVALGLICLLSLDGNSAALAEAPPTVLLIEPTAEHARNGEGAFVELKDGRLALVYTQFGQEGTDFSSADLAIRTSGDGGETWSPARLLLANREAKVNIMSVSILRLAGGELLLFYLRVDSRTSANLFVRRSTDEFRTLSAPLRVTTLDGYNVVNNDRAIQTSSGRIIVPANLHTEVDSDGKNISDDYQNLGVPFVYFSDDEGRTWKKDKTPILPVAKRTKALQENGVVELADGRLWMFMRTYHFFQYGCYSSDDGVTWSTPQPTSLASPLSPATIKRIPGTGDLLCVWNDHSGTHPFPQEKSRNERTPLCVAISSDEGVTWNKSRILEDNPQGFFCYTAMAFHGDRVLLAYMARNSSKTDKLSLKVRALSKDWIYSHD